VTLDQSNSNGEISRKLVNAGSEITGNISSTVMGMLLGGPIGGVVGAAISPLVTRTFDYVGQEILTRYLGPRELTRVGAVFHWTTEEINNRLNSGEDLRSDDFFNVDNGERSYSAEVLEGIFTAVQKSHEERKIKFYAKLFASICFDNSISREDANQLNQVLTSLTHRQLIILSILDKKGVIDIEGGVSQFVWIEKVNYVSEIRELERKGLTNERRASTAGEIFQTFIDPVLLTINEQGQHFYNLIRIDNIDYTGNKELLTLLEGKER